MPKSNNNIAVYSETGTNIISDSTYKTSQDRKDGAVEGSIAKSNMNNTALKQSTLMASALAELMATKNVDTTIGTNLSVEEMAILIEKTIGASSSDGDMTKANYAPIASITPGKTDYVDKALDSDNLGGLPANQFLNSFLISNISLPTTAWVDDTTQINMVVRADILNSNVDVNDDASVRFDGATKALKLDNTIVTENGKISIFLESRPTQTFVIENIRITRAVE